MKTALLGLLLLASPLFAGTMLADSMLSLQDYVGGSVACSNSGITAATCSTQNGSPDAGTGAYATGNLALTGSGLVYTLTGSLEAGQEIFSRADPMAVFSAALTVPETSGNWIVSGSAASSESSRYAMNVFVNGLAVGQIGNGSTSFLVHHSLGAPLTFSLSDSSSAIFSNDIENLNFSITFTDPPADPPAETPEPATLPLAAIAIIFVAVRTRESTSLR